MLKFLYRDSEGFFLNVMYFKVLVRFKGGFSAERNAKDKAKIGL